MNQAKKGYKELDVLNQENASLEKIKTRVEDDLEACKTFVKFCSSELIKHMQNDSE